MASAREIAMSILDFTAPEFDAGPATDVAAREERLLDVDFSGIAINALASLAPGDPFHIAVASSYSGKRDFAVPLGAHAILLATNRETGAVTPVRVFRSAKAMESRHGDMIETERPDPDVDPDTLADLVVGIDWIAPADYAIGLEPGEWSFSLVWYDWRSNAIDVTLRGRVAPKASERAVHPMPDGEGVPSYARPSLLTGRGAEFAIAFRREDGRASLPLRGEFAVNARPAMLVRDAEPIRDRGEMRELAAIVPVTLVLTAPFREPLLIPLGLPVYGGRRQPGALLLGSFTLDVLADSPGIAIGPGRYAAYLAVDGALYGPKAVEVTE